MSEIDEELDARDAAVIFPESGGVQLYIPKCIAQEEEVADHVLFATAVAWAIDREDPRIEDIVGDFIEMLETGNVEGFYHDPNEICGHA